MLQRSLKRTKREGPGGREEPNLEERDLLQRIAVEEHQELCPQLRREALDDLIVI